MKKVIFDCDNTFGMTGRDVDDGLTLFYLLGVPTIDLLGITLTYGNGNITEVMSMTKELKHRLKQPFNYYAEKQGAEFLVQQINRFPNQVTIIATGALTNLYEAYQIDPEFFMKVREIVLMGGTVEPLIVNQRPVNELNFSCDPRATKMVLLSQAKLTIMNGHMTAEAFFSLADKRTFIDAARNASLEKDLVSWIDETLEKWIEWNEEVFGFRGFCNWDMTTAVYLERPELFSEEQYYLANNQPKLDEGRMILAEKSEYLVKMPKTLLSLADFNKVVIQRMVAGLTKMS